MILMDTCMPIKFVPLLQKKRKKNPEVKLTTLISLTCRNSCACTEITIEASLFKFKLYIPDVQRNRQPDAWIVSADGEESLMK
jgi:hypothetical protein